MANRRAGDPRGTLQADEDDWFRGPSVGRIDPGEVAWQDEPELPPPRPTAARHPAVVVSAVVVAVVMIAAGILLVRAITGSGGGTTPPGRPIETPTTPSATTPVRTAPRQGVPSVTSTTVPTARVLRSGSAGAAVKGLQHALTKLGYAPGAADGSFGPATVQAVIAYQKANRLPEDGVAGAKTLAAINLALRP